MEAPTRFTELLREAFGTRLRIRWSQKAQEFQLEQQVGRAALPPIRIDEGRDDLIRARDGYDYVMSIRAGDRMPCPKCNYKIQVPIRDTHHIQCAYCKLKGRQTHVTAGFWPLDDSLIDHLRKIDPLRGAAKELTAAADRRNQARLASAERELTTHVEAVGAENFNRLVGIQQVGFSGKEHSWDHI